MLLSIVKYFILFVIYSTLGWIMEVFYALATKKKLTNRGFLIGPYCPIYGIGCVAIIILLSGFKKYPVILFILAILICSVLEYFTSYIMEKLFKARWWDYTKVKFNINGRICLDTMLPFGIIACIVMYVINPVIAGVLDKIPDNVLIAVAISYAVILLFDIVVSFNIVNNFKKTITSVSFEDRTDDINKYIRELLSNKSRFHRRLLGAFPNGYAVIKSITKDIQDTFQKKE